MISGLMFKPLIHFEFISCVWCKVKVQFCSATEYLVLPTPFVEETILFPHCVVLTSLSKIIWPYMCGLICDLSILFHWSVCLFLCWYYTGTDYCSFVIYFEIRKYEALFSFSRLFWLFGVLCGSIWILGFFFLLKSLGFW